MRKGNRLSPKFVTNVKDPGRYCDGHGLWLQVGSTGTRSWLFVYMLHRRARQMGLGALHTVGLKEARQRAGECRALLLDGIDPIEARNDQRTVARLKAAKSVSFRAQAEQLIASHAGGWKSDKHKRQWRTTLETYAYPVIGDLPVAAIETDLVMQILTPIWSTKTETASRVRMRIERVLDAAKAQGLRGGDNPARWRGHLDKLLAAPRSITPVKHHPAVPWQTMPQFMADLRQRDGMAARALEFTALTALRVDAVLGARWDEIDLAGKIWTVPPERNKGRKAKPRELRVPLSSRAIAILESLPRQSDYVFPGCGAHGTMADDTLRKVLQDLQPGCTTHGLRSSFKDWAAEHTGYPDIVSEMALGHAVADATQAAYRRGDLYQKRVAMMAAWASYCEQTPVAGAVVALHGDARKAA